MSALVNVAISGFVLTSAVAVLGAGNVLQEQLQLGYAADNAVLAAADAEYGQLAGTQCEVAADFLARYGIEILDCRVESQRVLLQVRKQILGLSLVRKVVAGF